MSLLATLPKPRYHCHSLIGSETRDAYFAIYPRSGCHRFCRRCSYFRIPISLVRNRLSLCLFPRPAPRRDNGCIPCRLLQETGAYVSDIMFLTPYAQLVQFSSRQGMYTAQQAEIDGRTKFSTVEIIVYINFTDTYAELISDPAPSRSSGAGVHFRHVSFWRDFQLRAFDGNALREPASVHSEPQYRCSGEGGCALIGSQIHLSFPAESFSTDTATVEVTTPDDQFTSVDFDLSSLR